MAKKKTAQKEIKVAYIGGGSRYWAQMVMTDLALAPELTGEIVLYDVNYGAALKNVKRAKDIYGHKDAKTVFKVSATKSIRKALTGADFVFLSILPGPMQMFANDIDIPKKYGILQPVGDTTGPGGISRAMRTVPIYEDYARQIMRYCPDAWVINYTNPMTLCTRSLYATEPDIKAFGCCHEVFGTQNRLSRIVQEARGLKQKPARQEIKTDVAGVNHFTWVTRALYQGEDIFPLVDKHIRQKGFWSDKSEWAEEQKARGKFFGSQGRVAFDLYRRFGALGAAGDRHLAEFVPWYTTSEENLHRWGVVLTPSEFRLGTWEPPQNAPSQDDDAKKKTQKDEDKLKGSGEEGVLQMLALLGMADLDTNVNIPNRGQIPELPLDAVVESNAQFRHDSLRPVTPTPLPAGASALVRRIVDMQELTLRACQEKSKDLAFQAMLLDPLCRVPTDQAKKMFNEMVRANKDMLEGWK
ncbi:MAG: alpha-glucosidase/alpha-galactosidase [Candidatus Sumerlaeota bacterium]